MKPSKCRLTKQGLAPGSCLRGTSPPSPAGTSPAVPAKSPLTNGVTCSNSGGQFPAMLKRTGIDGVIIEGSSDKPVYLWATSSLGVAAHL